MRCRLGVLAAAGLLPLMAQPATPPECTFLRDRTSRTTRNLSSLTARVTQMRGVAARAVAHDVAPPEPGTIDDFIFADFTANGITPAPLTTDWEFIRRVTLDLTGRIPPPDRVLSFVASTDPNKRAALIDELLAKPEWTDKWTMFFGDLYKNTALIPTTGVRRYSLGVNAFYQWIYDSLSKDRPYNLMVTELLSTSTGDTNGNGAMDWMLSGVIPGIPIPKQDTTDQLTANAADTFLGIGHVNCLLCHNGHGHLDGINLWGSTVTRYQAWQLASFFSHTSYGGGGAGSSTFRENLPGYTTDYALNTTTGNRPARQPSGGCSDSSCPTVAPVYIFTGDTPLQGESYRPALARLITSDFQFARATVNYFWAELFGRGIVDPPDSFDPARLDPANPPPDPWTLEPTNAALLNALAQHFIDSGYNLKALMREIANSQTYQLSSRYEGDWNAGWEPYFARKFVRRLWAEEVHDAIVQSSGILPHYQAQDFPKTVSFAMQLPDVVGTPWRDPVPTRFLDSFLRGNRDAFPHDSDGTISQALSLMNSPFVESHLAVDGDTPNQLITSNLGKSNTDLVRTLFLTILSRYPTSDELAKASAAIPSGGTARTQGVQDLVWSLYNKVDFVFNY